mgnify:CR=1 FL=1
MIIVECPFTHRTKAPLVNVSWNSDGEWKVRRGADSRHGSHFRPGVARTEATAAADLLTLAQAGGHLDGLLTEDEVVLMSQSLECEPEGLEWRAV